MSIQRWTVNPESIWKNEAGSVVLYTDHQAELQKAVENAWMVGWHEGRWPKKTREEALTDFLKEREKPE